MKFRYLVLLTILVGFMCAPAVAADQEAMWAGFEAFSFDRPQYYYNVKGHDYTEEEIDSMVRDFHETGFSGIMLEFEYEYNSYFQGLGRGWYAPTNGDSIISQYFKDDKVTEYFISAAKKYGLKVSVIVSSLNDRIGTNDDGFTEPYSSNYPWWIYPDEKAFDLFKRKVDIIASLDVDAVVIDFASTPDKKTAYNDTVYAVLELTDSQIDYIKANYPGLEVYVAVNPTYRDGVALDKERVKTRGAKALHWENHDYGSILGVESSDEGYFIYPVHPSFWWYVGLSCPVNLAKDLVYGTNSSPAVVFLHTPLTHQAYLNYSLEGVIGPGLKNHCPVLEPIPNIEVKETQLVTIVASATDPDNDSLTFHIDDPRFDNHDEIFTWLPQEGDRGIYDVMVSAADPYCCADSQSVEITVTSILPDYFFLISPDGDTLGDEVNFHWQESVSSDPEQGVTYCLCYSTSETFDPGSTTEICGLTTTSYTLPDVDFYSTYYWKVKAHNGHGSETWSDQTWSFFPYRRMDANCDGEANIQDLVYNINYLYLEGEAPCITQVSDNNCSGIITMIDILCQINYLFKGDPPGCGP
jgi:hypothetical protein